MVGLYGYYGWLLWFIHPQRGTPVCTCVCVSGLFSILYSVLTSRWPVVRPAGALQLPVMRVLQRGSVSAGCEEQGPCSAIIWPALCECLSLCVEGIAGGQRSPCRLSLSMEESQSQQTCSLMVLAQRKLQCSPTAWASAERGAGLRVES